MCVCETAVWFFEAYSLFLLIHIVCIEWKGGSVKHEFINNKKIEKSAYFLVMGMKSRDNMRAFFCFENLFFGRFGRLGKFIFIFLCLK